MKKSLYFILLATVALTISSCNKVKPKPPVASELDTVLQAPISVVHLPVKYRVSAVQDLINEKLKGTFVKKWMTLNEKGDSMYLEVSRQREIQLSRSDRTLHYTIPLKISGKFKAKVIGIKVKNEAPVEAEIDLLLATTLQLDPQWNMIPETQIEEIKWIKEPSIKLGFTKLQLRKPIESILANREAHIIDKADSTLQSLLKTRQVVQKLWMDIQKPIRINKKGVQVWLKAYAEDLSGHVEDTEPDLISLNFKLVTHTSIIYEGDSIPPSNPKLPNFRRSTDSGDSLNIYVHSLLRFDVINKFLNEELQDKPLSAKGFTTTIKHLNIYGTPTGIAVEIKVKGDVDGSLYVRGTPVYDTLNHVLKVVDFDFDIDSENSFLTSADWLLHTTVLDLIDEKLRVEVAPLAAKLPNLIMQGVEKGKTGEKIDINIDTLVVHPRVIITTKDNLQLIVQAQGRASLDLEKKIFEKKKKPTASTK